MNNLKFIIEMKKKYKCNIFEATTIFIISLLVLERLERRERIKTKSKDGTLTLLDLL